ncbi:MAG: hypothetical protein ACM3L6_01055 [Deltaproteobacteria bacterium]
MRYLLVPWGLLFLWTGCASAAPDDGFGRSRKLAGAHFDIYVPPEAVSADLVRGLDIGASDKLLAGAPVKSAGTTDEELAASVDALFFLVCDILDMPLFSYKGSIKVCRDEEDLGRVYAALFGKKPGAPMGSFYVHELNTIYIAAADFRRPVLGHEIGHAVISNFFVVPSPMKVQEVLAGYVEYQLRKAAP